MSLFFQSLMTFLVQHNKYFYLSLTIPKLKHHVVRFVTAASPHSHCCFLSWLHFCCCDKIAWQKEFVLTHNSKLWSLIAGKSRWLELQTDTPHPVKSREKELMQVWYSVLFFTLVQGPHQETLLPAFTPGLPLTVRQSRQPHFPPDMSTGQLDLDNPSVVLSW